MNNALISGAELAGMLDRSDVKILDASYGLPEMPVRIGKAIEFDIDDVAAPDAALAHTLPSPEVFAAKVGAMGISNSDTVVVYDRAGLHMAASRVWWMFRVFGHDKVFILNGGFPAWVAAGLPLEPVPDETENIAPASFKATLRPGLFKQKSDMLDNLSSQKFTVLDARDPARYSGTAPEPRPGMSGGHIPGSLNVPFSTLLDPATGLMRNNDNLKSILRASGVDEKTSIAISCGSGVTACVVALALYQTGHEEAAIYGGSWAEWGSDQNTPKEKGKKA